MSTRSVIGKFNDSSLKSWSGRYCHWDGYPTGVGQTLYSEYKRAFEGNLPALIKILVTDKLVGWSAIAGCDLTLPSTWDNYSENTNAPKSYSKRGETPRDYIDGDIVTETQETWCEWAYVFDVPNRQMHVLEERSGHWLPAGIIDLDVNVPGSRFEEIECGEVSDYTAES